MESPDRPSREGRWTSLWVVALLSLVAQLALCQFFTFGDKVPASIDINPSNLWKFAYHYPPTGSFQVLNWLGLPYAAAPFNPLGLAAEHFSTWLFFTAFAPLIATGALLAMAAFLREFGLSRPAALFGGVIYAWQGDLLPFIYPGHFGYITSWPFFAIAAWGALRSDRTGHWAYPIISGAACGIMVGLLTNADRGSIASLLVGILYIASILRTTATSRVKKIGHLALCVTVAGLVALAPLLGTFKTYIVGVKLAGTANPQQTFDLATQYSIGPAETLTYLAPGFFGWHSNHQDGPYWGWIGEWPDWPVNHQGTRNFNLAISTTGTIATVLALVGLVLLLPGNFFGPDRLGARQRFFGRVLLAAGLIALVLSWGWHTPLYRPLLSLPLMDKWRNPLKWLEMTNFALVVLGSIGLQHLFLSLDAAAAEVNVVRQRLARFTIFLLIIMLLLLGATYPLSAALAMVLQSENFESVLIANMMSTMHTSVFLALVLLAVLSIVLRLLWQPARLREMTLVNPWLQRVWQQMLLPEKLPLTLALVLSGLATIQLGWVANQFIQAVPLAELTASNPLLEALRSERDVVRVSVAASDPLLNSLLQNQFSAMNISCFDVSAASRIPDDFSAFMTALDKAQQRMWFLAGVKNVVVPEAGLAQLQADPAIAANIDIANGYTLEPTGSADVPSHALVEMKAYLAKATLIPNAETFSDNAALLNRLADPAWKPRESVLLNEAVPASTPPPDSTGKVNEVDLKTYTPKLIEIAVHSAEGGYVLINDQYDPDWQVEVNGQSAELLRADYIMRAVRVPPGDSSVTLRYVAHYRLAGVSLPAKAVNNLSDGVMIAAWLIAGIALWRRRSPFEDQPSA